MCFFDLSFYFRDINSTTLGRKEQILAEAFKGFVSVGVDGTTIESIAKNLKISKKTIYLEFRTKEDLMVKSLAWKLDRMTYHGNQIVNDKIPVIDKFIKTLEAIDQELKDVTMEGLRSTYQYKDRISPLMDEYLRGAVFDRFRKLLDECRNNKILSCNVDINAMLVGYWETLSTFLFVRSKGSPIERAIKRPFYEHFNIQLIYFLRGLLNEEGIRKFDEALTSHPVFSKIYGA